MYTHAATPPPLFNASPPGEVAGAGFLAEEGVEMCGGLSLRCGGGLTPEWMAEMHQCACCFQPCTQLPLGARNIRIVKPGLSSQRKSVTSFN